MMVVDAHPMNPTLHVPSAHEAFSQNSLHMPHHIAFIMDGNGRWAQTRGLPRFEGHRRGMESVQIIVRTALELHIPILTLYSFSSENWSRPQEEISDLMGLLKLFIHRDLQDLHAEGVKIRVIGSRKTLSPDIRDLLEYAQELTKDNNKLILVVAFNYGGRQEIVAAAQALAWKVQQGDLRPEDISLQTLTAHLETADLPDPDLLIRTSGEQRLSNFLIWQMAYTEFVFMPQCWPDFDRKAFIEALEIYSKRERRFGGCSPSVLMKGDP